MCRYSIAVLMAFGSVLSQTEGVAAQETEVPEGISVNVVVLPYAGVADNPREVRLPVSPMGGMRATAEVLLPPTGPVRLAAFLGGAATIMAVNAEAGLEIDYLTTGLGGIRLDVPTHPYVIGFFGRGYPVANRTYDTELRKWLGGDSVVYGWGAGLSPVIGGSSFNIEGRYRRDQRMPAHLDESFEVLLGFPTRISW
ncbi:MAG: hypothetical protein F4022_14880 [Gemmatimonadetes bacterium]|nr:hypothetical protein [Gemmatimonadota bacterium]MYK67732.1 hypothetical protein [Gemmatimonadota bacterium]